MNYLKENVLNWLLEENNPSVQYLTLTKLLDIPETNVDTRKAKANIMKSGIVPKILAKQIDNSYWVSKEDFYVKTKYKGTVWQLIVLAELFADGSHPGIRNACELIMQISQNKDSGGFAYRSSKKVDGIPSGVIPCLTGNMLFSMIRFGFLDDHRIQKGIDWCVKYMRFDDGEDNIPQDWQYKSLKSCWGRHICMSAVVTVLKALAEIPVDNKTDSINEIIQKGVDFILKHRLFKSSHNDNVIANPDWLLLGFPLIWKVDILEMLLLLAKLGIRDNRTDEAIELLLKKQDSTGKWQLEKTFNGRLAVNIEQKGKPSKWITLRALIALKYFLS